MDDRSRIELEFKLEQFKSELAEQMAANQREHEGAVEMLRATVSTGMAAIRTATLINGGACVAVLAFLGTAWSSSVPSFVRDSATAALGWFVFGVFLAGIGSALAYLSQAGFGDEFGEISQSIGKRCRVAAIGVCMASFVVFAVGAVSSIVTVLPVEHSVEKTDRQSPAKAPTLNSST
jgi:hypothetical protein